MDDNPLEDIPTQITEGGSQEVFNFLGQRLAQREGGGGQY